MVLGESRALVVHHRVPIRDGSFHASICERSVLAFSGYQPRDWSKRVTVPQVVIDTLKEMNPKERRTMSETLKIIPSFF